MTSADREQITLPVRVIEPGAQEAIARLQRQCFVELGMVQQFHAWLDDKRQCRQACRVIGDFRTGKTIACDAYRLKYATQTANGDAPIMPVLYWHATTETGQRELFVGLLEYLKYRITNGSISDLRERVYRLLRSCQVEMIILDEAHRFRLIKISRSRLQATDKDAATCSAASANSPMCNVLCRNSSASGRVAASGKDGMRPSWGASVVSLSGLQAWVSHPSFVER